MNTTTKPAEPDHTPLHLSQDVVTTPQEMRTMLIYEELTRARIRDLHDELSGWRRKPQPDAVPWWRRRARKSAAGQRRRK